MVTGAEIGLGIQALKTAFQVAKDAKDLTDTTAMRSKIIDLQGLIMQAQAGAIEAREAHSAQVEHIRELEAEVARLKTWEGEKERYELKAIGSGAYVYALKPSMQGGEPPHWLCPSCYQKLKKSILQEIGRTPDRGTKIWRCSDCRTEVRTSYTRSPESPGD